MGGQHGPQTQRHAKCKAQDEATLPVPEVQVNLLHARSIDRRTLAVCHRVHTAAVNRGTFLRTCAGVDTFAFRQPAYAAGVDLT